MERKGNSNKKSYKPKGTNPRRNAKPRKELGAHWMPVAENMFEDPRNRRALKLADYEGLVTFMQLRGYICKNEADHTASLEAVCFNLPKTFNEDVVRTLVNDPELFTLDEDGDTFRLADTTNEFFSYETKMNEEESVNESVNESETVEAVASDEQRACRPQTVDEDLKEHPSLNIKFPVADNEAAAEPVKGAIVIDAEEPAIMEQLKANEREQDDNLKRVRQYFGDKSRYGFAEFMNIPFMKQADLDGNQINMVRQAFGVFTDQMFGFDSKILESCLDSSLAISARNRLAQNWIMKKRPECVPFLNTPIVKPKPVVVTSDYVSDEQVKAWIDAIPADGDVVSKMAESYGSNRIRRYWYQFTDWLKKFIVFNRRQFRDEVDLRHYMRTIVSDKGKDGKKMFFRKARHEINELFGKLDQEEAKRLNPDGITGFFYGAPMNKQGLFYDTKLMSG